MYVILNSNNKKREAYLHLKELHSTNTDKEVCTGVGGEIRTTMISGDDALEIYAGLIQLRR